jgi:hypothetical protein
VDRNAIQHVTTDLQAITTDLRWALQLGGEAGAISGLGFAAKRAMFHGHHSLSIAGLAVREQVALRSNSL